MGRSRNGSGIDPDRNGPRAVLALAAAALVALAAAPAPAPFEPPPAETLQAIAERGRAIALAITAASKARDKLSHLGAAIAKPDGLIVIPERETLHLVFLKDPEPDAVPGLPRRGTVVLAETDFTEGADDVGDLRAMSPPRAATSTMVTTLRAGQAAESEGAGRAKAGAPYEKALFRERDGTFTAYLLPEETPGRTVIFGGDLVVRVMANGRQAMSVESTHQAMTEVSLAGRAAGQPTLHAHASGDLPSPGDVALIRLHPSLAPHLVLTPRAMFRIDALGAITYLGPNPAPLAAPEAPGGAPAAVAPPSPAPALTPAPNRTPGGRSL